MHLFDQAKPAIDGELWVKPFDRNGNPLADPFSIFQNPDEVRAVNSDLDRKSTRLNSSH